MHRLWYPDIGLVCVRFVLENTIPDNAETELLAALLQKPFYNKVAGRIAPADFRSRKNRLIYEAIVAVENQGKISDVSNVLISLTKSLSLSEAGGREYVLGIAKLRRTRGAESAAASLIAKRSRKGVSDYNKSKESTNA